MSIDDADVYDRTPARTLADPHVPRIAGPNASPKKAHEFPVRGPSLGFRLGFTTNAFILVADAFHISSDLIGQPSASSASTLGQRVNKESKMDTPSACSVASPVPLLTVHFYLPALGISVNFFFNSRLIASYILRKLGTQFW